MAQAPTQDADMQLAKTIQNEMKLVKADHEYMSKVISNLHKAYNSTTEESHYGRYTISLVKFDKWARMKAKEICRMY